MIGADARRRTRTAVASRLAVAAACLAGIRAAGGGGRLGSARSSRPRPRSNTAFNDYARRRRHRRQAVVRGLRRARRPDPPGGQAGRLRRGEHDACPTSSTRRAWSGSRRCSRPTRWCWRSRGLRDRLARRPDETGHVSSRSATGRAGRLLHARGARQLPADQREAILDNVRSEEPDVSSISASSPRERSTRASSTSPT